MYNFETHLPEIYACSQQYDFKIFNKKNNFLPKNHREIPYKFFKILEKKKVKFFEPNYCIDYLLMIV